MKTKIKYTKQSAGFAAIVLLILMMLPGSLNATERPVNIYAENTSEAEMEIEFWMLHPNAWAVDANSVTRNGVKEAKTLIGDRKIDFSAEIRYDQSNDEIPLEPWMFNTRDAFWNELLNRNEEIPLEKWMTMPDEWAHDLK
jgi:hypothetical protein